MLHISSNPISCHVKSNLYSRAAFAACVAAVMLLAGVHQAAAQGKKAPRGGPGAGHGGAPGMQGAPLPPGVGAPAAPGTGGMGPGGRGMPGGMPGYGMKGADKKSGPAARTKTENPADEYDNESLPPGYRVPQEPPDAFSTDEEWIENPTGSGDAKAIRILDNNFRSILQSGEFQKDDDKDKVAKMVRYRLSQLTLKEKREQAAELRQKLENDIAASNNKTGGRPARILALKTVAEEAPRLFQYHFVARLQGAILLAHLSDFNETEAEGVKKAAVPCTRAAEPLIELVSDNKQLTAVRVWGINGLVKLATLDAINSQLRNRLVDVLVAQMNASGKEHEWYQLRLAEGLGKLTTIQNQEKRPVVPQALAMVLADTNRPVLVRAEAAQSLGRLQYDSSPAVDVGLIAYESAKLTQQIVESYNKSPRQTLWKLCLMRIYGSFKPLEDEDAGKDKVPPKRGLLTQAEGKPSLSAHRKTVQEAFENVLPLVAKVVGDGKEIDPALANLKKWLDQNVPKTFKINPDEAPIISKAGPGSREPAGEGVAAGPKTGP